MNTEGIVIVSIVAGIVLFTIWRLYNQPRRQRSKDEMWEKFLEQFPQALSGKSFHVILRERDGRMTDRESKLIQHVICASGTVKNLPREVAQQIWKSSLDLSQGLFADYILVGTTCYYNYGSEHPFKSLDGPYCSVDYRLLKHDGDIIFSDVMQGIEESQFAREIVKKLHIILRAKNP